MTRQRRTPHGLRVQLSDDAQFPGQQGIIIDPTRISVNRKGVPFRAHGGRLVGVYTEPVNWRTMRVVHLTDDRICVVPDAHLQPPKVQP